MNQSFTAIHKDINIQSCDDPSVNFSLEVDTNGNQGGDAGHGGLFFLTIRSDSAIFLNDPNNQIVNTPDTEVNAVKIGVEGDWEMDAFANALIDIGTKLLTHPSIEFKKESENF